MKRNKAFTLIELVSVLVILAILALIVTPLVLNIIRKARTAADKRSIDAYGRSIELAIADYLLENGTFPTSIDELTIEYSGDRVVCSTTRLNEDSSVYLSECTVGGRIVAGYTYGKGGGSEEPETPANTSYSIGDQVTYNEVQYYVIKDSDAAESTVTLLKAEPLSYEEVQKYLNGSGIDVSNNNNFGAIKYHNDSVLYSTSYIKTVVDSWTDEIEKSGNIEETRLLTYEELVNDLGMEFMVQASYMSLIESDDTPEWLFGDNYSYWTMSINTNNENQVWIINNGECRCMSAISPDNYDYLIRPVIVLKKSALN